jgi:hypothetical protein
MSNENILTLCVQIAFGVITRLIKARVTCSVTVALGRDAYRADVDVLFPLDVDELIEKKILFNYNLKYQ